MKLFFAPLGFLSGLAAGMVARWGFEKVWGAFVDHEPPEPDQREISYAELVPALLLEGAVFRLVKGLVDRGARVAALRLTGRWPGEREPEGA